MIDVFGTVQFNGSTYEPVGGSGNWIVEPIVGFAPPARLPLGQIQIQFSTPIPQPYAVLVTAERLPNTPLVAANYGDCTPDGFVVHAWETVADRTVQNTGFSFLVLTTPGSRS